MVRKNLGFQDTNFEFSLTFLCRKTGMTHKTATKAVDGLLKKNSIKELTNGDRRVRRFQVVWKTPEEEKVFDDPLEIPIPEDVLPPHLQTESIKDVLRKHVREHVQKQASDWVEQYVLYALKNCSGKQDEDTFRAYLDQSMIDEWRIGKQKPPAPSPTDPKKICDHEFAETANGGKMCRKCDRIIDKDGNIVN
ncbi:MAG: hypothetical protein GY757_52915 [bacterium]|nr:hypothetical protein [bacterium]